MSDQATTEDVQGAPPEAQTPFEAIGGKAGVRGVVDRFYDLMDSDRRYGTLRELHAEDLAPMRESLAGFLTAWLGGPRDWFETRPGACVMSIHARVPVDQATAAQWVHAMARALADSPAPPALADRILEIFEAMSANMARMNRTKGDADELDG